MPHAHLSRSPLRRRLATAVAVTALAVATPQALAADITGSVTAPVTVNSQGVTHNEQGQPVYWDWAKVTMDVTWSVPNGTQPGDHFLVPIDNDLNAASFIPFELKVPDGSVVAHATRDGDNIRFTLTDYVATHRDVRGVATFALWFDTKQLNETVPTVLDVYDTRLVVNRDPGPDGTDDYKFGSWMPNEQSATALDENGALVQRNQPQIQWTVQLRSRVDNPLRDWTTATIVDTPASGSLFDCTRTNEQYTNVNPRIRTMTGGNPTTIAVTVASCAPKRLELRVTKQASDRGVYRVTFNGWFETNALGQPVYTDEVGVTHVGFNPNGLGNRADMNYDGWTRTLTTRFLRTAQGGSGQGTNDVTPRIDIEKYTGAWNGIPFVGDVPALDATGQPLGLPAGDHDVAPGVTVPRGDDVPVTFRVTNTGTETLNAVTVTDETLAGASVGPITCAFNGSTSMPFAGLAPGQSFLCTATLRGVTSAHADRATVSGVGATSGRTVTDNDLFHATPTPVTIITGTPTPVTPSPVTITPPPPDRAISLQQAATPRLTIAKRSAARVTRAGATVRWTIDVRNVGGSVARNVRICDTPARASFRSKRVTYRMGSTARTATLAIRKGSGCFTVPRVAAGATVRVTVFTTVARSARQRVVNTATATATRVRKVTATASVPVRAPRPARVTPAVTG